MQFVELGEQPEWRGKWKQYTYPGYISIARKAENYCVLGNTKWVGAQLADGSRVEHVGDLGGRLRVEKDHAYLGSMETGSNANYDCAAEFVRVGRFLIVHDNAQSGGVNVRFDGVYSMTPPRR